MSGNIFTLKEFMPIGYIIKKYPVEFCVICRGKLIDKCNICVKSEKDICEIIELNESLSSDSNEIKDSASKNKIYVHNCCYLILNKTN